ncbi:DUF1499 domain-containing protein [uncultured Photobacterium sp.]|uniref:DUF1499 domain-containing protein n=1 Tax=uncultured Photobacterium sp. TaxID=173973 RepID=UPI002622B20B|nr:DUF1499 domain-containing protein [uncultured Photobacterium sp.]
MKKVLLLFSGLLLLGCSKAGSPPSSLPDRTGKLCGDKPNCVSTIELRDDFKLPPFELNQQGVESWQTIIDIALSLPGAGLGQQENGYIRIECRSRIFGFIDDFEIRQHDNMLIVRSESRTGYSDFGVNRKRAEQFRHQLLAAGLLKSQ